MVLINSSLRYSGSWRIRKNKSRRRWHSNSWRISSLLGCVHGLKRSLKSPPFPWKWLLSQGILVFLLWVYDFRNILWLVIHKYLLFINENLRFIISLWIHITNYTIHFILLFIFSQDIRVILLLLALFIFLITLTFYPFRFIFNLNILQWLLKSSSFLK